MKLLTALALLLAASRVAQASLPATHSHTFTITVPIAFGVPLGPQDTSHHCTTSKYNELGFGALFTSPNSGTVTVSPSGVASYSGGVLGRTDASCTVRAAEIVLDLENHDHMEADDHASDDNSEYERSEDDDEHTNDDRSNFSRHGCTCAITLPTSSTLTRVGGTETMSATNFTISRTEGYIYIGATLHVSANQRSGSYAGSFTFTVCVS